MMNKLIATAVLAVAPTVVSATVTAGVFALADAPTVEAPARRLCADSNGAKPGGSVYVSYKVTYFNCDVRPPQRLHITQTPNRITCEDMGGGYDARTKICWDVDY